MLLDKLEKTVHRFNMLKPHERVVVAVSGGPDSVALTYLLHRLSRKYHLNLHLAHLNHLLRGAEGEQDAQFVQELARRLGLRLSSARMDARELARRERLSVEEAARQLRYDFLFSVARETGAGKIALGHSRDDQAETILMRFLRGSGLSGLKGIPPTRELNGCLIIRPLIEIRRSEILHFLSRKKIPFRTDSSNLKEVYLRNRIRHLLLPLLEREFNPAIKETLVNFAENISSDFDYLQKSAQEAFQALRLQTKKKAVALNRKGLLQLHPALQKLVLREAITRLKGNVRRIDYRHWKELEDLLHHRPVGSIVDLPQDVSVCKREKDVLLYKKNCT